MRPEPLDFIPLWLLFSLTCLVSFAMLEAGFRYGRRRAHLSAEEKEGTVSGIVASILALFAFMLAFTFGMAGSRFETRRQVILEEANSIGTTYLRAKLLHEPQRSTSLTLLREYVDVRVRGSQKSEGAAAIRRSEEIHTLLWTEAEREAAGHPNPVAGLYITSLNETIDIHTVRVQTGMRNRIPVEIWIVLYGLSIFGMVSVGYQSGFVATRRSPTLAVFVFCFASVLCLIADLERPQEGLTLASREALVELQKSIANEPPPKP